MATTRQDLDPSTAALAAKADKAGATLTGATVDAVTPSQFDLIANGAKATATMTLIAFGTWATGDTVVVPGLASFTIQVDATPGDLDLQGMDEATAKAALDLYITTNSTLVSAVTTGSSMVLTAKAYGTATNRTAVTGTLFTADGAMASGLSPQISNPMPSNQQPASVKVYDAAFNGASVLVSGLSAAKRYRILATINANGASEIISIQPNSSAANCKSWASYTNNTSEFTDVLYFASQLAAASTQAVSGILEPRTNGLSNWKSGGLGIDISGRAVRIVGATSTDFTSLLFVFSATTRTGWLTVIEETP
jgi:hypothetical protein